MLTFKQYLAEQKDIDDLHRALYTHYPKGLPVYHETPGHQKESILRKGLQGDYGIFGTIGKTSEYVTSKKKTITHFVIPPHEYKHIAPDMRYGDAPNVGDNPETHLFHEHGETAHGAAICYNSERIPNHWVKHIHEIE